MDFAQCITSYAFMEVKYTRSKFPWWNDRINHECKFKRLDRVLINLEFMNTFHVTEVEHLIRDGSDHVSIHIVARTEAMTVVKPFRFQNCWCKHKDFLDMVKKN